MGSANIKHKDWGAYRTIAWSELRSEVTPSRYLLVSGSKIVVTLTPQQPLLLSQDGIIFHLQLTRIRGGRVESG